MMRSTSVRLSRDDGMGILEVMIAATILFIVLTGVLGLILQSTNMGLQSKRTVMLSNAVSSYVERVQAMTFAKVDLLGVGDGELSVETITVGGFTVVIVPEEVVADSGVSGLKMLTITATMSRGDEEIQALTTSVVIRDKDKFLTEGLNPPVVSWGLGMPAVDEVVWGTQKASGGSLYIMANIKAVEGKTLKSVSISADGALLQNTNVPPDEAYWEWSAGEQPEQWSVTNFLWNTAQERPGETTGTLVPAIPDGRRTILIIAVDSAGADRSVSYTLTVDNHPPGAPSGPPVAAAAGPLLTRFSWGTASDGTDLARGYQLFVRQQAIGGTWGAPATHTATEASKDVVTAAFSRYWAEAGAVGPPPNSRVSETQTAMTGSWITPPRASGTATVTRAGQTYTTQVNLAASTPQFPVVGTPQYVWEYAPSDVGPWTEFATGPTATNTVTGSGGGPVRYYRCRVTFQPGVDYGAEPEPTSMTMNSTVAGPTPATTGTNVALEDRWLE